MGNSKEQKGEFKYKQNTYNLLFKHKNGYYPKILGMKKSIQEITKIMSKTAPDGEVTFEPMESDMATKLNGTEVVDSDGNRVKIKDTGRTLTEESYKIKRNDLANISKDLTNTLQVALREHGDTISYVRTMVNPVQQYVAVYVNYEQDPDNPGKPSIDKFIFRLENGKVYLEGQVICDLSKQSGILVLNRDLAKNSILNFLNKSESDLDEVEYPNGQGFEDKSMESQDSYKTDDTSLSEELLLGFKKAIQNYRKNTKDKKTIKELLKQIEGFEGDSVESKLKNAIQLCKNSEQPSDTVVKLVKMEEPVDCENTCNQPDVCMDLSLFIKILEFVREDMVDSDTVLHQVAERVGRLCKEKGQISMSDYNSVVDGLVS